MTQPFDQLAQNVLFLLLPADAVESERLEPPAVGVVERSNDP